MMWDRSLLGGSVGDQWKGGLQCAPRGKSCRINVASNVSVVDPASRRAPPPAHHGSSTWRLQRLAGRARVEVRPTANGQTMSTKCRDELAPLQRA